MLNRRRIIVTALALALLGVAGYASLNPSFAAACRSAGDTGAAWLRNPVAAVENVFRRSGLQAAFTREMRALQLRELERQRAAAAAQRLAPASAASLRPGPADATPGPQAAGGVPPAARDGAAGFAKSASLAARIEHVLGPSRISDVRQVTHRDAEVIRPLLTADPGAATGEKGRKPGAGN